jgi:hypothetical protein
MRDKSLPRDEKEFFKNLTEALCNEHNINFKSKVIRPDDLIDDLCNFLTEDDITNLLIDFNDEHSIDENLLSESNIINFLRQVATALVEDNISPDKEKAETYKHVNKDKKIALNKLEKLKPEINKSLKKTYVIDAVVTELSRLDSMQQFEIVKNKTIMTYNKLTSVENYNPVDVYNGCIKALVQFTKVGKSDILCAKLTVAYLFQMCTIFKKE